MRPRKSLGNCETRFRLPSQGNRVTMRALIIVSEAPPVQSGVAKSVEELATGLRARGHDVEVVSSADAPSFRRDEFRLSLLAVKFPGLAKRLRQFDVVNVHGPSPSISDLHLALLRLIPRSKRPRVVYTHHFTMDLSPPWTNPLTQLYDRAHRWLASWTADRVIVTTDSYRELVSAYTERANVHVVPWGVDHRRFHARNRIERSPGEPLRVLYLGQLRQYKGPDIALAAIGGQQDLFLTLAGGGPMADGLESTAAAEGWNNVAIVGRVSDAELPALFASHDVVVLPSTTAKEAFGIVLLEGMASGCVPVATDLPGLCDIAGLSGTVVPVEDPQALQAALLEYANNPIRWAEQSVESIEVASKFDWSRTVDEYEALLEW